MGWLVECACTASQVGIRKEGEVKGGKWGFAAQHRGEEVG